jgi:hypothetical protein
VKMVFSNKIFTFHAANTCVALPNTCRRSVRALYHNNNGSQSTVVKTVELSLVLNNLFPKGVQVGNNHIVELFTNVHVTRSHATKCLIIFY